MTSLFLLALLAQAEFFDERQVVSSAPLITSGITSPGPASCTSALRCYVGAADGGAVWQCTRPNAGNTEIVVTAPAVSPTYEDSPFYPTPGGSARKAMAVYADNQAPYILAGHATDAGLAAFWASNHTVVLANAYSVAASINATAFDHGTNETKGFTPLSSGVTYTCRWLNGASSPTSVIATVSGTPARQAVVHICTKSGTNYYSMALGSESSAASWPQGPPGVPTTDMMFGAELGVAGRYMNGPLHYVELFPCALTLAEKQRLTARWWGTLAESRNVTTTRVSTAWQDPGDGGQIWALGNGAGRVDPRGLFSFEARTNYWANSLDAVAWTDVGTPILDAGTASGPFSQYAGSAEVDQLTDDDASALEGKQGATAGTATGQYTVSCYLAAGTSTDYSLSVTTDGTGSGSCAGTDLTSAFSRKSCTVHVDGGSPTYVYGRVLVGDAVGDTGTILTSECQLEKAATAGPPIACGAAACATVADAHTMPSAGLPTTSGRVTLTYRPMNTESTTRVLLDTLSSNNGVQLQVNATNAMILVLGNGTATTSTSSSAQTWTGGTDYLIEFAWGNGNAFVWRTVGDVRTLIASTTNGTAKVPTAHATNVIIGAYSGGAPANGWVSKPVWSYR